mmetsp:Transcript_3214/g.8535  ORF Transcript_3214/g.8535 Transcript_3214/m.8535 type:complete len:482 (+) Transcript_3214:142-1587(+)
MGKKKGTPAMDLDDPEEVLNAEPDAQQNQQPDEANTSTKPKQPKAKKKKDAKKGKKGFDSDDDDDKIQLPLAGGEDEEDMPMPSKPKPKGKAKAAPAKAAFSLLAAEDEENGESAGEEEPAAPPPKPAGKKGKAKKPDTASLFAALAEAGDEDGAAEAEEEEQQEEPEVPQEFMFESEGVIMDPNLYKFAQMQQRAQGRTGKAKTLIFSDDRGRYIKPMIPKSDKVMRLAVDATLRSAAPYQKLRRNQSIAEGKPQRRVYVEKGDMRSKKLARKAGALVIFVTDASGSMALNRMSAAKGACMRLLSESYTSRDQVALVPFYGDKAEVLLPPSKSIAMAKKRMDALPCGGGSPLAHGLSTATRLGLQAQQGGDTGRVMVVLITDGRANISLARSNEDPDALKPDAPKPTQEQLKEEVRDMARKCGAAGLQLLVIDTENKFVSTGFAEEIAKAANGQYYYLPNANDAAIAQATSSAMAQAKQG